MTSNSCSGCPHDTNLDVIGWYCSNKNGYPGVMVGGAKTPNAWGLFDMAGNAWEWCHDDFVSDLGTMKQVDPVNVVLSDNYHVHRGGGASYHAKLSRAAVRGKSNANGGIGIRCVRTLSP